MKEWNSPDVWSLGAEFTEQGGQGGANDGYHYDIFGRVLIGTSGPSLEGKPLGSGKNPNAPKYPAPDKN